MTNRPGAACKMMQQAPQKIVLSQAVNLGQTVLTGRRLFNLTPGCSQLGFLFFFLNIFSKMHTNFSKTWSFLWLDLVRGCAWAPEVSASFLGNLKYPRMVAAAATQFTKPMSGAESSSVYNLHIHPHPTLPSPQSAAPENNNSSGG